MSQEEKWETGTCLTLPFLSADFSASKMVVILRERVSSARAQVSPPNNVALKHFRKKRLQQEKRT